MFKTIITPEKAGISSKRILDFFKRYESYNASIHSIIMARGDHIFAECYYAPFNKDFKHRMYSSSKSFVGLAIGLCEEDGLLSLDDKMIDYFGEYIDKDKADPKLREQTIRDMLKMSTSIEETVYWFTSGTKDRAAEYFKFDVAKMPGSTYKYDSPGSYMLGVIVEKVTGKPFMEYLKERVFQYTDFSKDAYCLKCPGGHSWGDSAVICTARDLLIFARFVMNKGVIDGKRYMNSKFLEDAVSKQVDNDRVGAGGAYNSYGYGYQIWKMPDDGFAFIGMGDQLAICHPKTDFIFIINADHQGFPGRTILIHEIFHHIIPYLGEPMEENPDDYKELSEHFATRKLVHILGDTKVDFADKIDGKTFVCDDNPMKIEYIRVDFDGDKGTLSYKNEQGDKKLMFGMGYNEFLKFPQEGYSDEIGTYYAEGNMYDCACSGAWTEPQKLKIKVQIIDKYFASLCITLAFKDEGRLVVEMVPVAEAFLKEYSGIANCYADQK